METGVAHRLDLPVPLAKDHHPVGTQDGWQYLKRREPESGEELAFSVVERLSGVGVREIVELSGRKAVAQSGAIVQAVESGKAVPFLPPGFEHAQRAAVQR